MLRTGFPDRRHSEAELRRTVRGRALPIAAAGSAGAGSRAQGVYSMQKQSFVVFDFDGTLSTLRCGWEQIMQPMMLEMICPDGPCPPELEARVAAYIDQSTGIQTVRQMQWLAGQVEQSTGRARDAWYYKEQYNQRILRLVAEKQQRVLEGRASVSDFLIEGAAAFLQALRDRGCRLFLASGTDDADVKAEARFLGLDSCFERIKGAPPGSFSCSKEQILRELMPETGAGAELSVIGDGKVEIALARRSGALAVGIASNEAARRGVDARKRRRLEAAGADVIFGDFTQKEALVALIMREALT